MPRIDLLVLALSTSWIEVALVIFVIVFLVIVGWVLLVRPGAFDDAAKIPLEDDVVSEKKDDSNKDRTT